MPIKNQPVGPLFTRLGIIRLGDPKKSNAPGKATPYFQLRDAKELIELLGAEQPTELNVMWPFNDVDRNLDDYYRLYGAGSIKCRGDGEVMDACVHGAHFVVSGGVCTKAFSENGEEFKPGDIVPCGSPGEGARYPKCAECEIISYPKVMVIKAMEVGLFGYYQIGSGSTSKHGRANIRGALEATREFVRFLTGRPHLAGIPMVLSLQVEKISVPMTDKQTGEQYRARMPKPILHLVPHPDWVKAQTTTMLESAYQPLTQLAIPTAHALPAPVEEPTNYVLANAPSRAGQDEIEDEIIQGSVTVVYSDQELRDFKADIQDHASARHLQAQAGPPTHGNLGLSVGLLNDVCGDSDGRKLLTAWIYDLPTKGFSSKGLSGAQISAILDKFQPTKDADGWRASHPENVERFRQALRLARTDSGQMELELPKAEPESPIGQAQPKGNFPAENISTAGEFYGAIYNNLGLNKTQALALVDVTDLAEIRGTNFQAKYQAVARALAEENK